MLDLLIYSVKSIFANKVRSFLTMLGIIVGITSMLIISVIGRAFNDTFASVTERLYKADRMTMASSLEGRVPFIDKEVFKVASSLPFDYKVTKENTKVALRDAAKEVIPTEAYKKKKLGFPVPVREWMKEGTFMEEVKRALNSDVANKYFNVKVVNKMFDEHISGKKDNYRKIWTIYTFIKWYETFFVNLINEGKKENS